MKWSGTFEFSVVFSQKSHICLPMDEVCCCCLIGFRDEHSVCSGLSRRARHGVLSRCLALLDRCKNYNCYSEI